jgi:hypothetical protein
MKLAEMLAIEFLEIHKDVEKENHYTALLNILMSLVEIHKPINKAVLAQAIFIDKNTSEDLVLELPIAETLYFKYKLLQKRGNFNITYTNRGGLEKQIKRNKLKLELSKAKTKMFKLYCLIANQYSIDIPYNQDGEGV